jgi:hypothetical protein
MGVVYRATDLSLMASAAVLWIATTAAAAATPSALERRILIRGVIAALPAACVARVSGSKRTST